MVRKIGRAGKCGCLTGLCMLNLYSYHMDIKPQNILCFGEIPGKGDFELKLADFGFSQVLVHDGAESAEQPWVSGGTALYRKFLRPLTVSSNADFP